MGWHADRALLSGYVRGEVDETASLSLEAHVLGCSRCRAALGQFADPERLHRAKEAVFDAINPPRRGPFEALLIRAGVTDATARLVAATPSLRASWFAAVTLTLGFAVIAANQSHSGLLLFLVVAPLLPVIGVAAAYGPSVDPTYEIGLAAPLNSLRLLLLRGGAVLTATIVLAGVAGMALPGSEWTVAWLLPALGLTLGSVALSTVLTPLHAARLVGLIWLVAVTVVAVSPHDALALFRVPGQIIFALLAGVGALVIAHRRDAFNQGRLG
jgi:hypothetical protein